jgi:hypothetical protein
MGSSYAMTAEFTIHTSLGLRKKHLLVAKGTVFANQNDAHASRNTGKSVGGTAGQAGLDRALT